MAHDRMPVHFPDVLDIVRRYDHRHKPTVKLGYTQEAANPRGQCLVSLDAYGPDGSADQVRAINATGFFIGAGVRVQVRYDRPARACIECIVSDISGDDRNAWEPRWELFLGSGTPSIGNGELIGRYQIINGRLFWEIGLTTGSTSTFGTGGLWLFTLPDGIQPTATAPLIGTLIQSMGTWYAYDASANNRYAGLLEVNLTPHIIPFTQSTTSLLVGNVNNATPFSWTAADADKLFMQGNFPIAGV